MKYYHYILLLCSSIFSTTINIPGDYPTIQEGIDVATTGDTVLVADGDYQENIVISKSIVLTSHAIFDDLDDWVAYDDIFYEQWVINNSHIANTRIIGNNPGDDYGSAILITPDGNTCISPEITGFTIQYGLGTLVERDGNQVRIGGGILADISDPLIKYNAFVNNGNPSLASGGAIQLTSSAEDWSFNDRLENVDPRCEVEEFRISDNLYDDNDALYGNSVANRFHEDSFDMSGSIFDVFNCGADPENSISSVWVDVEDDASVDYSESEGNLCSFTASDVYVNSNIDQECLEEGCGFINNPFKTISRTLEMILPTANNPITIHLASGTYSPETGETFPIIMMDYVNIEGDYLLGNDPELPHLDAMQTNRVITMIGCLDNSISNVVVENGYFGGEDLCNNDMSCLGGGLYLEYSSPTLYNVEFRDNYAYYGGGGIYMENSQPSLFEVNIIRNTSTHGDGGGIYMTDNSNAIMSNMSFLNNYGEDGAALLSINSSPLITNTTFEGSNTGLGWNDFTGTAVLINGGATDGGATLKNIAMANNANYTALHLINAKLINATIAQNWGAGLNITPNASGDNIIEYNNGGDSYCGCIGCYNSGGNFPIDHSSFTLNGACEECPTQWPFYCDCIGGSECSGTYGNIINFNPLLANPGSYNYTLLPGSPCIDTGDTFDWNLDIDGTPTDMGYHGGSFIHINPNDINFGNVGNSEVSKNFTMFNYRETPITINSVSFTAAGPNGEVLADGEIFSSDALFPLTINPLETGIIQVDCLIPESYSHQSVNGEMTLYSNELPDGLAIYLQASHSDYDQSLNGELSGNLPAGIYNVVGDIYINAGDTLHLSPGTEFIFNGDFGLHVYGELKAQGTEQDSIIFRSQDPDVVNVWFGLDFHNVTSTTELDYVRISGVNLDYALFLENSDPIISNILLTGSGSLIGGDCWDECGGISLLHSSPEISNLTFNGNMTTAAFSLENNSNPILNNIIITNNTGGGSFLKTGWSGSEVIINNMLIENNLIIENNNDVTHGIYVTNNFMIDNIIIRNNSWDSTYPGTAIVTSGGQGSISNAIIENNSMDGLHVSDQTTLNNISIKNNGGSGIVLSGDVSISNTIIIGNGINSGANYEECIASGSSNELCGYYCSGGGIHMYGGAPSLVNVTIADNVFTEEVQGGGIYFNHNGNFIVNNEPTIINSIIYNNYPYNFDENFQYMGPEPETYNFPSFLHSDVEGGLLEHWEDLGGNINLNPIFVDPNNGDFTLQDDSPCIDAGTAYFEYQSEVIVDIPNSDYYGSAPDMGAFEYISPGDCGTLLLGDLNNDDIIDILDIVQVINIVLGTSIPTPDQECLADINEDGIIDILDIVIIVNVILGD